ncbi:type II secretion system protein GspD [Caenimonas sedimenti]|uniref:Type II secretion system protein GspD n=1 Tax=Caenimonas sedimenti TaxID=2596921 RepID=A0A562ZEH1_9BURK|nr:type II secretion system secretin GspD [Caenimonas sedimenti]TWO65527.1 type II secretion system protein GspD [Caenimonas sedimenti]
MISRLAAASLAAALLLVAAPGALHAQRANEPVTLNFVGAEIEAVARTMAAITGRNIVVDPRVKGTINLSTDRPVSPAAAFNQFMATLRLSGFTVVESGGLLKVVPEADAKLQGGAVSVEAPPGGGQIVTQIFRLNYENAGNLVPILRPLISPNNTINVNPGNNSLVITDYADNLQRMARIIAALDVSNATDVEVLNLQHALASDLAPIVQRLVETGGGAGPGGAPVAGQGQADTSFRTTVIAEPRSNSLIVRAANAARLNLVRSLVARLDQPGPQASASGMGNIYVVYLKNADATKLAAVLRAAIASNSTTGGGAAINVPVAAAANINQAAGSTAATAPVQGSAQPSTGGQIQADPATNSLIITAPEPQYRQLRAVIDRLDARRAQVFVESLIAEVNAEKAADFGIQWMSPLGRSGNNTVGVLGTNFSPGVSGTNIIDLALTAAGEGTTLPSPGLNIGVGRKIGGVYVLSALARFLESKGDGNILSTPNLLTLDNEEAKIVIGQNVPFVTGQYSNSNSGTGGTVNPFQTIERKDVGLTLRVRPQISENGTVKLQIFQEVSNVVPNSVNSASGIITNKRSIESNVLVEDGGIVVLGGLLQDEYAGNVEKVPGVGDVPFFGNLFKSETRSRKKLNLMVFLRPIVVRDASQTESLSLDRYDLMKGKQEFSQPVPSVVVPVNESPILPSAGRSPAGAMPAPAPLGQPATPTPVR